MKLEYGMALAIAFTLAAGAQAQTGHQAHDKDKKDQGAKHSMQMPALNDHHFVRMMTMHHQQGVAMSKAEESRGARDAVKAIAAKIREGQERDIAELQTIEQTLKGGESDTAMQKHHQMMEEMARGSMQKIESATAEAADRAFLEEMTRHHQMGLNMVAKATLKNPELRRLAQRMASEQKREIADMKQLMSKQ